MVPIKEKTFKTIKIKNINTKAMFCNPHNLDDLLVEGSHQISHLPRVGSPVAQLTHQNIQRAALQVGVSQK